MKKISMSKMIFGSSLLVGAYLDAFTNVELLTIYVGMAVGIFASIVAYVIFEEWE